METLQTVNVSEAQFVYAPLTWQRMGLQQTASGYGRRLVSSRKVWIGGKLRRVYVVCFSNSGSAYVEIKREKVYLSEI